MVYEDIQLPLSLLIATTTALFGLLFLWAATSSRPWFVRTAVAGAVLSLFLLIPAYELFVCFVVHGVVVVGVMTVRRWLANRRSQSEQSDSAETPHRFSLGTLLLLILVVASLVAVTIRLPRLEWTAWAIVVAVGLQAAIQTTMVAWMVFGKARLWIRVPLAAILPVASLLLLLQAQLTYRTTFRTRLSMPFGDSIHAYFQSLDLTRLVYQVEGTREVDPRLWWNLGVTFMTFAIMAGCLSLLTAAFPIRKSRATEHRSPRGPGRVVARVAGVAVLVLIAAIPARVYWRLRHPTEIPAVVLPEPNGYETLLEANGNVDFQMSQVLWDPYRATPAAIRLEVTKHQNVFDLARTGLANECMIRLRYDTRDLDVTRPFFDQLAKALCAEGHVAKADRSFGNAARSYLTAIGLGPGSANGGLMNHGMRANGCEFRGLTALSGVVDELSSTECREIVEGLWAVDSVWEPAKHFIHRDRIWNEHARGWQGRLDVAMLEFRQRNYDTNDEAFINVLRHNQTLRRLLIAELAVRAYRLESGRLPDQLFDVVPTYLPDVPLDPYSDATLLYAREGESYRLYSVGPDRVNDGGKPLTRSEYYMYRVQQEPGDLFVSSFFGGPDVSFSGWVEGSE